MLENLDEDMAIGWMDQRSKQQKLNVQEPKEKKKKCEESQKDQKDSGYMDVLKSVSSHCSSWLPQDELGPFKPLYEDRKKNLEKAITARSRISL